MARFLVALATLPVTAVAAGLVMLSGPAQADPADPVSAPTEAAAQPAAAPSPQPQPSTAPAAEPSMDAPDDPA
ncbi:MAG TPA: hypothetical protein PKI77_15220, partial [Mycobacterium sp.]|nr:hypothetical protein [Mycobacterium sp.]